MLLGWSSVIHYSSQLLLSQKMGAPAFQIRLQFPLRPASTSIRTSKELKVSAQKNLEDGSPSVAADKVQRRAILQLLGVNVIFGNVCCVLAAPMQQMKEPKVPRTLKLASGVRIQALSISLVETVLQLYFVWMMSSLFLDMTGNKRSKGGSDWHEGRRKEKSFNTSFCGIY